MKYSRHIITGLIIIACLGAAASIWLFVRNVKRSFTAVLNNQNELYARELNTEKFLKKNMPTEVAEWDAQVKADNTPAK